MRCCYGDALISLPMPGEKPDAGKARTGRKGMDPFLRMDGPGTYRGKLKMPGRGGFVAGYPQDFVWEERARIPPGRIRRLAEGERCAAFDKEMVASPLSVRPLRAGDRIRPFALDADKKVKEILIDRKVHREERWGRPVVCDAKGKILWIPGVVRSGHAPVTTKTRRAIVLRVDIQAPPDE